MNLAAPNDHDLLIRLDTKMDALTASIAEVKTAVASKADGARVKKLENVVEGIRSKFYMAAGALAALQFVIHLLWK